MTEYVVLVEHAQKHNAPTYPYLQSSPSSTPQPKLQQCCATPAVSTSACCNFHYSNCTARHTCSSCPGTCQAAGWLHGLPRSAGWACRGRHMPPPLVRRRLPVHPSSRHTAGACSCTQQEATDMTGRSGRQKPSRQHAMLHPSCWSVAGAVCLLLMLLAGRQVQRHLPVDASTTTTTPPYDDVVMIMVLPSLHARRCRCLPY